MSELTPKEQERYRRQIQLPGFGEQGQRKLKAAAALVTRVGGLGGPTALYLAMAGIGRLIIAHGGRLTESNLNRQLLMRADHVGRPRIECAPDLFARLAPDVQVTAVGEEVDEARALSLVEQVDLVCDCAPSFEERFALNRACLKLGRPMVEAAMYGMEGQLTTFLPGETPCLECLVPDTPDWWQVYGFPVLGAVSASLGCLAAVEAIKLITGCGPVLAGKLLAFDTSTMDFRQYTIRRRPDCAACGHLPDARPKART